VKRFLVLLSLVLVAIRCGAPKITDLSGQKFTQIVEEDLRSIRAEIQAKDSSQLLSRPYYRVIEYLRTTEGREYTIKAVVEFYYLDKIKMRQMRKYRFVPAKERWERYESQIQYNMTGHG